MKQSTGSAPPSPRALPARVLRLLPILGLAIASAASAREPDQATRDALARSSVERLEAQLADHTVAEDIALLRELSRGAREAQTRLIERGPDALDAIHAALLGAQGEPKQRLQLISVIRGIGVVESVPPLLTVMAQEKESQLLRAEVIDVLGGLPATPASIQLAQRLAADESEPLPIRQGALVFLGRHQTPGSMRFARALKSHPDVGIRTTALFLAARMGDKSAAAPIEELLRGPGAGSQYRYLLLSGLAEILTPSQMDQRVPGRVRQTEEFSSSRRVAEFRASSASQKRALTPKMLDSALPLESQRAARFLLESEGPEVLAEYGGFDESERVRSAVQRELRQSGYRTRPGAKRLEIMGERSR